MARPSLDPIESGTEAWDAFISDNFAKLTESPIPLVVAASAAALASSFPADEYDACTAIVWDGTPGNDASIYVSDGSNWNAFSKSELKAVRISSHSTLALSQTVDGTYVYSLSGFSGVGYDAAKVRSILVRVAGNSAGIGQVFAKMFGEATFTNLCIANNVAGTPNVRNSFLVEVPIEDGQVNLELQLVTGFTTNQAGFDIYGARQIV